MNVNSHIILVCENINPRQTNIVDWNTGDGLWNFIEATGLGEHRLSKDFIGDQLGKDFGENPDRIRRR